jgi:hypothetical protein
MNIDRQSGRRYLIFRSTDRISFKALRQPLPVALAASLLLVLLHVSDAQNTASGLADVASSQLGSMAGPAFRFSGTGTFTRGNSADDLNFDALVLGAQHCRFTILTRNSMYLAITSNGRTQLRRPQNLLSVPALSANGACDIFPQGLLIAEMSSGMTAALDLGLAPGYPVPTERIQLWQRINSTFMANAPPWATAIDIDLGTHLPTMLRYQSPSGETVTTTFLSYVREQSLSYPARIVRSAGSTKLVLDVRKAEAVSGLTESAFAIPAITGYRSSHQ